MKAKFELTYQHSLDTDTEDCILRTLTFDIEGISSKEEFEDKICPDLVDSLRKAAEAKHPATLDAYGFFEDGYDFEVLEYTIADIAVVVESIEECHRVQDAILADFMNGFKAAGYTVGEVREVVTT